MFMNFFLGWLIRGLTSHQKLRPYGDRNSVNSLIRQTGGPQEMPMTEPTTPGLQDECNNHCTCALSVGYLLVSHPMIERVKPRQGKINKKVKPRQPGEVLPDQKSHPVFLSVETLHLKNRSTPSVHCCVIL